MMKNKKIAQILKNLGTLLEIKGENSFKVKSYYKAASNILDLNQDIDEIASNKGLSQIPGIGKAIESKILEFLETGTMHTYQKTVEEIPETLLDIVNVPSIGPQKAKLFYDQLHITNLYELYYAAKIGSLLSLPGIQQKTVDKILKGIDVVKHVGRIDLESAIDIAEKFCANKFEDKYVKDFGLDFVAEKKDKGIKSTSTIEQADIQGDLHVHSSFSDGHNSIEDIVLQAINRKYQYVAVCDHSQRLKIAKGLTSKELREKKKLIDQLNKRYKNCRILFGTEVEIDTEGNLDYNNKLLSEFDIVVAAIHVGHDQEGSHITKRLVNACKNKYVHVIAHPFGIHFGKRKAYDIDFDEICKVAVDNHVCFEINSFPFRLDLSPANASYAKKRGAKFVINTDSHALDHFDFMRYGVCVAQRAGLEKEDVLNSYSLQALMKELGKGK